MARARNVEEVKQNLSKKASVVAKMLATDGGRALLEVIEEEFFAGKTGPRLIGGNPQETAYRVGAYDVVLYLKQLQSHFYKGDLNVIDPLG